MLVKARVTTLISAKRGVAKNAGLGAEEISRCFFPHLKSHFADGRLFIFYAKSPVFRFPQTPSRCPQRAYAEPVKTTKEGAWPSFE